MREVRAGPIMAERVAPAGSPYTIALEEHFATPEIMARIGPDIGPPMMGAAGAMNAALFDLGDARLARMDAGGVDVQVISHTAPGLEHVTDAAEASALARAANDLLLDAISRHPDRFAGFATLAVSDPKGAAEELRRCVGLGMSGALVNGSVDGRFLDDPVFEDLLSVAAELAVPLYLHPGVPPEAVVKAYYAGLPENLSRMLASPGWGWHADTAVHVLRLTVSGAFDRHPGLQIVIGHMGEMLPVMVDRASLLLSPHTGLPLTVRDYLTRHVSVTLAGFYSVPAFQAMVQAFGIDRVMFSTDDPYVPGFLAQRFIESVPLSPADRWKVACGNAAALLGRELPPAHAGPSSW